MIPISERYNWQAERPDGEIITKGGDLAGCAKLSLIPAEGSGLPGHDIAGVEMVRRFCRGFIRVNKGGLREYLHCVVCKGFRMYVSSATGAALITPEDYELYI